MVQAGNPATQFTELLLYDPNCNLVAIAAGNYGSASEIDFTVPQGDAGNWIIEVTNSLNESFTPFSYDLLITGDTGIGPINPLSVPEPSSLLLMGTGTLACFGVWRCQQCASSAFQAKKG